MARARDAVSLGAPVPIALLRALGSFLLYRVVRALMTLFKRLHAAASRGAPVSWWVLRRETLERRFALAVVMTTGPRWNPHALIAGTPPLRVAASLRIEVARARAAAEDWTVVVSTWPGNRAVASVGSAADDGQERWARLELPPGRYALALRYYGWREPIELPAVEVDGRAVVPAAPVSGMDDLYRDLRRRETGFYRALQAYVYPMLAWRRRLPETFVRREFLPVGNPETDFVYGCFDRGERLSIRLAPDVLERSRVLLTVYSRASFPIAWYPLAATSHATARFDERGYYLLRLHPRKTAGSRPGRRAIGSDVEVERERAWEADQDR